MVRAFSIPGVSDRSEFISKDGFGVKGKNEKLFPDRRRATILLDEAL
jgi:hypothetical protein